ncbi:ATP-dependent DNA helicase RecG [Helicobacter sp. 11S02629-2]|uniref:ATP-dependent DNA helicase RecG n=1 Tax=Helicobacter sp. 11S02629-2 TaxID=1476195 RepID=UPI000BA55343|nr:ATP-dependent DNA helicase RecG [Helicobacter sp. 11S02629-2]PAF45402.1 ATP-dependent DNA helicase RecG [Helicobacter sp. 11S02629-2]
MPLDKKPSELSLLYLALDVPKRYISTFEVTKPAYNSSSIGAFSATILSLRDSRKFLFIEAYLAKLDLPLTIYIFNHKPFHKSTFKVGSTLSLYGRVENKLGHLQVSNPKPIKALDSIIPIFNGKKNDARENLNAFNLERLGLDSKRAHLIEEIYKPNLAFFKAYEASGTIPKPNMDALKYVEIWLYLYRLSLKKRDFKAKTTFLLTASAKNLKAFLSSLPFSLTSGQMGAIKDVQLDLASPLQARRIIMGDVGCGKTMVILSIVAMSFPKRVLLMAPTTILATQLYNEAIKFLPSDIQVVLKTSQQVSSRDVFLFEDSLANAHFVIGTQALLFLEDEVFKDFSIVMSDEQHRFGTKQRSKLEALTSQKSTLKSHIFQFSATPIPRTMAMIKSSYIKFSFIRDLPFKKDITTSIVDTKGFPKVLETIKQELAKGHQVAIIYPLVQKSEAKSEGFNTRSNYLSLEEAKEYWLKNFEHVYVTHGKDKEKDSILEQFRETKGAILLATTMVEVGLSLPLLSVVVIMGAELLGLASLHQLRGRVSRNGLKGYCFLCTKLDTNSNMESNSQKEALTRLERFAKTLSGFDIAELDLEYRSSGDLIDGVEQSGDEFKFFNIKRDSDILQEALSDIESLRQEKSV